MSVSAALKPPSTNTAPISDSRLSADQGGVGYVPFENLIGRAELIFFSIDEGTAAWEVWRWPWTVRWNRMFQRVR